MSISFLQSKKWAEFQESFGRKVFWVNDKLVVKFDLPLSKSWLYVARPDFIDKEDFSKFIKNLSELAQKENVIFAKLEPDLESEASIKRQVLSMNSKNILDTKYQILNSNCLQPQDELALDISKSSEELLNNMHSKTRYNIRLAQKNGLEFEISHNPKDVEKFYELALKTSVRDGFKYHSKNYYRKMIETLSFENKDLKTEFIFINNQKQVIATSIMLYYNEIAYYLHGASDHEYRSLMAPYLMQWKAILRSKELGLKWYNFGGIASQNKNLNLKNQNENLKIKNLSLPAGPLRRIEASEAGFEFNHDHPWAGITRFKTGFAPPKVGASFILHYPGAYDIIFQRGWHAIYKLSKKFKF